MDLGRRSRRQSLQEIRQDCARVQRSVPIIETGGAAPTVPLNGRVPASAPGLIRSARNTLYTSGTLGRYLQHAELGARVAWSSLNDPPTPEP